MSARTKARIERLVGAHEKLSARYLALPDGIKKDRMGKRILEIEQSMKNLNEYGRETIAGSNESISVDVPTRNFSIRGEE